MEPSPKPTVSRRQFMRDGARLTAMTGVGVLLGVSLTRSSGKTTVWQIDPGKCLRCDQCASACVLEQSAVKCVHAHAICGYCQLCTGYFTPEPNELNTAAENQLCPTAAIRRSFIEDPYYEIQDRREALHRLRQVRRGLQSLRQRLALPPGAAGPLPELQRVRHCPGVSWRRIPARACQ